MNLQLRIILKSVAALLPTAALLTFAACSSKPPPSNSSPVTNNFAHSAFPYYTGLGGDVVVDSLAMTNIVVSLDPAARKIELRRADGSVFSYTAGPQVVNYDKIKVGDLVKATVVEEMAVYLIPAGSPEQISTNTVVVRDKTGALAGAHSLETIKLTAKILSIDAWGGRVTLQLPGGSTKTVKVRAEINLADFQPGDEVRVRLTQALAVLLENP